MLPHRYFYSAFIYLKQRLSLDDGKSTLNTRWFMLPAVLWLWSWRYSYSMWFCGFYCDDFYVVLSCSLFSFDIVFASLSLGREDCLYAHRAFETPRDKTNKITVRPAKTEISLGIRPV